jgi:hypothetical protein
MTAKRPSRHGLNALKARVMVRGISAIDRRTLAARDLLAWRGELLTALGGEQYVSPQKRALVENVVTTKLYIAHIDSWLLAQPSLINRTKKAILPILRERQSLVDSFSRLIAQIGAERVARPIPSLAEVIREADAEKEESE